MTKTKLLITGATGLLGRPLFQCCRAVDDWQVTGTAWSRTGPGLERIDLADTARLPDFLRRMSPRLIIHSAAERRPDVSEKDPAGTQRLNVEATGVIAQWAKAHGAFLIYLSTDYVFDGTKPPYRHDDPTQAINAYGQSKLDGERAILAAGGAAAVLRVPILYGPCESLAESAVTVLAQNMLGARAGTGTLTMEHWATRYPTLTSDLAVLLRQMAARHLRENDLDGIYHWSGAEPMTKYDMALAMGPQLRFDVARLVADAHPPAGAPRPKNCHLDSERLERLGLGQRTPFAVAIAPILAQYAGA
jgi:dTDP-4-dehydrorhamnose reductase